MLCRADSHTADADVTLSMSLFLLAIEPVLRELTIVGLRKRDAGSTVSLPIVWGHASTYGTGAGSHNESANYFDFVGRADTGRRARVAVFGTNIQADTSGNDYRFASASEANVAAAVVELNAHSDIWLALDGFKPTWYQYANVGNNAYWRNRIR